MEISRRRLADYVKEFYETACRSCKHDCLIKSLFSGFEFAVAVVFVQALYYLAPLGGANAQVFDWLRNVLQT